MRLCVGMFIALIAGSVAAQPEAGPRVLYRQGLAAQRAGKVDEAIALFDRVVAADPRRPEGWKRRGDAWSAKQQWRRAIADYDRALLLAPGFGDAIGARGWAKLVAGDAAGALVDCQRAAELSGPAFGEYVNHAGARLLNGDVAGARAIYRAALPLLDAPGQLEAGPIADLDLFDQLGYRRSDVRAMRTWLIAEYDRASKRRVAGLALRPPASLAIFAEAAAQARAADQPAVEIAALTDAALQLSELGQIDAAEQAGERAVARARQVDDPPSIVRALRTLALVERRAYRRDRATALLDEALTIATRARRDDLALWVENTLATDHELAQQYGQAALHYRAVLARLRTIYHPALLFGLLQRTGTCELEAVGIGPPDEVRRAGRAHLEEAVRVGESLDEERASVLRQLGDVHVALEQPDKARAAYQAALAEVVSGDLEGRADVVNALASLELSQRNLDRALALYEERLTLPLAPRARFPIEQLVSVLAYAKRDWAKALQHAEQAVALVEEQRRLVHGEALRALAANTSRAYRILVAARGRMNDWPGALTALELGRARALTEQLGGGVAPTVVELMRDLPTDTAALLVSRYEQSEEVLIVATRERVTGAFSADEALIKPGVRRFAVGLEAMVRATVAQQQTRAGREPDPEVRRRHLDAWSRDYLGKVNDHPEIFFEYERQLLRTSAERTRGAAREETPGPTRVDAQADLIALSRLLHEWLITPVAPALAGKRRWIVVPDGGLWALPFDALIDGGGRPVAASVEVGYTYSLGVRALLRRRPHAGKRKPLLAFGGARYATAAASSPAAAGSPRAGYQRLDLDRWTDLPGTLAEVRALAAVVPGAELVVGDQVREARLKALSSSGELARYRVLHFATHGVVVPEAPELSALVLSQPGASADGSDDGYLGMAEIGALKLDADFVALSACETGLGRIHGGEGVVGLTQAFLVAGAQSLAVSLWPVADDSTARFMAGVYELVAKRKLSHAAAIARMKQRFLAGELGDAWRAPYHWAAFAVYGE